MRLFLCLLIAAAVTAADKRVVFPAGAKPVGPYSPGIFAGDYLYVSGQGARDASNRIPAAFDDQARTCLENVKTIVEAAGLKMENIVYTQLYLLDMGNLPAFERIWQGYFPGDAPARATLGVARMPVDTPIELTALAVRDVSSRRAVRVPGIPGSAAVVTSDRVFLSGITGADEGGKYPSDPAAEVEQTLRNVSRVLKAAGVGLPHVVMVNPYLIARMPMEAMNRVYARHFEFGNTPARATIEVAGLPGQAAFEFTGVAVRDLAKRRAVRPKNMPPSSTASPCVLAGDTLYCSAKAGFIPGPNSGIWFEDVETQVRQTMRNLLDGLEEADMDFSHVVATNVYLDDINDFAKMNGVYGSYFQTAPPTRTTVAPMPPVERKRDARGRVPRLEQISLIAVK